MLCLTCGSHPAGIREGSQIIVQEHISSVWKPLTDKSSVCKHFLKLWLFLDFVMKKIYIKKTVTHWFNKHIRGEILYTGPPFLKCPGCRHPSKTANWSTYWVLIFFSKHATQYSSNKSTASVLSSFQCGASFSSHSSVTQYDTHVLNIATIKTKL